MRAKQRQKAKILLITREKKLKMSEQNTAEKAQTHFHGISWKEELEIHITEQIKSHKLLQKYNETTHADNSPLFLELIQKEFGQYLRVYTDADEALIMSSVKKHWRHAQEWKKEIISRTMPTKQDLLELHKAISNFHNLKELYSVLYRLKCNTLDTLRCVLCICKRIVISEDKETVTMTNPHHYEKHQDMCVESKDKDLLCLIGYYVERADYMKPGEKSQRYLWLTTPTVFVDHDSLRFCPDAEQDEVCPLTLTQLNIYCQMKKHDKELLNMSHVKPPEDFLRPFLCVQEGVCFYNEEDNQYKLLFPSSAVRLLHCKCKKQVQEEFDQQLKATNEILNRTTVIQYTASVSVNQGMIRSLLPDIMKAMEYRELGLTVTVVEGELLTLICEPKPNWRFHPKRCHHTDESESPNGHIVTTFCKLPGKPVNKTIYCAKHVQSYGPRREDEEEVREYLAYSLRPNLRVGETLVVKDKSGQDITLHLESVYFEPSKKPYKLHFDLKQIRTSF